MTDAGASRTRPLQGRHTCSAFLGESAGESPVELALGFSFAGLVICLRSDRGKVTSSTCGVAEVTWLFRELAVVIGACHDILHLLFL
jgi:hypothetical protein